MRSFKLLAALLLSGGLCFILITTSGQATLKYKKETGKKCTFCHTGIPRPGDEDPQLNDDGKKFKANDYKLTEEQESRPPSK